MCKTYLGDTPTTCLLESIKNGRYSKIAIEKVEQCWTWTRCPTFWDKNMFQTVSSSKFTVGSYWLELWQRVGPSETMILRRHVCFLGPWHSWDVQLRFVKTVRGDTPHMTAIMSLWVKSEPQNSCVKLAVHPANTLKYLRSRMTGPRAHDMGGRTWSGLSSDMDWNKRFNAVQDVMIGYRKPSRSGMPPWHCISELKK